MNLEFYRIIGESLDKGIEKAYRKGLASIVALNKKEILRLTGGDDPELFKINYTATDNIMLQNFQVEAFTVAGVMSYELEEKLKQLALDLQEGNHPLAKGEKDIKKIWIAEAQNLIAEYVPVEGMPPPNYLNTNLRTSMQSSYHAAQYVRLQDDAVRDLYPAYQYKTLADNRVRESHMRLHDTIWRNDDPVWDKIWPPNGWNCRCYIKPLNVTEMDNSAVEPKTSPEKVNDVVKEGGVEKDFQRNPGQLRSIWGKWLDTNLSGKDYEEITNAIVEAEYKMPAWEEFEELLMQNAAEYPEDIELTKENWKKLFGSFPGKADTPIGEFVFADDFYAQLESRDTDKHLNLVKPTLTKPDFVFVDNKSGTLFVKVFKNEKGVENYVGVLKYKGKELFIPFYNKADLSRKVNEGKFLLYQSLFSKPGNFMGLPKFKQGGGKVSIIKEAHIFIDVKNIEDATDKLSEKDVKSIIRGASEIWGKTYNYNGVVNSEIKFIRYQVEGFDLIEVSNNEAHDYKFKGYDKIDEFRKGVILYA